MVNSTELGAQEWRDALFLRYGIDPPDLPNYCDGCDAKFTICHALNCKRGGLVTTHHNKLRDGIADLVCKAFTPTHVRNDPLIFAGSAVKTLKANTARTIGSTDPDNAPNPEATDQKGDLLICDIW